MWTEPLIKTGCLLAASLAAVAGPLDRTKIASDAKWIVHIDAERLRESALGRYVIRDLVNPLLDEAEELKHANLSMNVSNITSITAYGPAFEKGPEGVLVVSTTADPKKDLDTVAGIFLLNAGTNAPFTLVEKTPLPLYTLGNSIFFSTADRTLFVAKSKEQIERAHRVAAGKAENLSQRSAFRNFNQPPNTYFSVAVAEGFSGTRAIPVQAQVLREAVGGRIAIGETANNVFLNLVFQGKDEMATTRIQQVLQGIVALVSLSQQDPEITRLAGGTKIAAEGPNVIVSVEYPVDKTIEKIKESSDDKPRAKRAKAKAKRKNKAEGEHSEELTEDEPPSAEIEEKASPAR